MRENVESILKVNYEIKSKMSYYIKIMRLESHNYEIKHWNWHGQSQVIISQNWHTKTKL